MFDVFNDTYTMFSDFIKAYVVGTHLFLFDLGLTSLSTSFSHIVTVSGCGRELNAHF